MSRVKLSPEQVEQVLARIPEGFILESTFANRFRIHNNAHKNIMRAIRAGNVAQEGNILYDTRRLTAEQAQQLARWCSPVLPEVSNRGNPAGAPIVERQQALYEQLGEDPLCLALIEKLPDVGYCPLSGFATTPEETEALQRLFDAEFLKTRHPYVYNPLRLSPSTMDYVCHLDKIRPLHQELLDYLREQPGHTIKVFALPDPFKRELYALLFIGDLVQFSIPYAKGYVSTWLRPAESDAKAAEKTARKYIREQQAEARHIREAEWETFFTQCGEVPRPDARDGKTNRMRVLARSYTITKAAKRLGVRLRTLEEAIQRNKITPFKDPDGVKRLSAEKVERAFADPEYGEQIAGLETLRTRQIALVSGVAYSTAYSRLKRANISTTQPTWAAVRRKWDLPDTLREFKAVLKARIENWREERQREEELIQEQRRLAAEAERQRREQLRQQLMAIFPTWQHEDRAAQHVILHIGPTNSGKTHQALNRLAEAGSGWYLAPLRLLAFEIFDRLNARGIPCNLLTGEEQISTPGARITAATIEMFDPAESGDCIVIDEAHMLADPDRGWAWTCALMEADAPELHVLGAPIARRLVERMAHAVNLPLDIVEHERLTPLRIADRSWSLSQLPPRTILIGFSRQIVLGLKVELERFNRSVSVIYGNLPPEVRRRQADRFAAGETEICVATDAVGMGLNLPADQVCFYELEKFDGKEVRELTTNEVRQIGGRAGRFGLSQAGLIGALTPANLKLVQQLYDASPHVLSHARIAPSVEALQLIPGTLAQRLREWASLESIPETLRNVFKTADLAERIELASMLQDKEVLQLGLSSALRLINAPTRPTTRLYWRACATAILADQALPLPYAPPAQINNYAQLDATETSILCADVYLWLGQRREFRPAAREMGRVRAERMEWSLRVDNALIRKVDTSRRCSQCGRKLPFTHPYRLCNVCYETSRAFRYNDYDNFDSYDDDDDYEPWAQEKQQEQPQPAFPTPAGPPADKCPVCKVNLLETAQARLAHWQETHPDRTELTISYAAWVVGCLRNDLPKQIAFDSKEALGNHTARYWKLTTLESLINHK